MSGTPSRAAADSGGSRSDQRRQRAAQLREEQRQADRRRRLLAWVAATAGVLLATAAVVGFVVHDQTNDSADARAQIVPSTPTGETVTEAAAQQVKDDSGIPGVLAWNTGNWPGSGKDVTGALRHDHVDGPVVYTEVPPVGGPHSGTWMNAGVYDKPIPSVRAVHNLEHGAVWITYRPDLAASQVGALTDLIAKQSLIPETPDAIGGIRDDANRYIDMSPWNDGTLPSPIVISAWGHQLRVTNASDPRLQRFIDVFRNNPRYTPEHGGGVDGVPVQTGGRPASNGGTRPNPAGRETIGRM